MKILFATDGSESAEGAAQLLRLLPLPTGSAIRALTVTSDGWETPELMHEALKEWARRTSEAAAASLARGGVEVSTAVRRGGEAHEILEDAEEWGADLIVLGFEGLSRLEEFVLGSVARNVAKHSRRPVLVARAPKTGLRRVVLAVDESKHAADALAFTTAFPLPEEAEIAVVHVVRPYHPYAAMSPEYVPMLDELEAEARKELTEEAEKLTSAAVTRLEKAGKHAVSTVLEGDPAGEILKLARARGADLIVAGARGSSLIHGLLVGSVADRLLRKLDTSVLLVH